MLAADDSVSDKKTRSRSIPTNVVVSYNGRCLVASPALSSRWPLYYRNIDCAQNKYDRQHLEPVSMLKASVRELL